jgi:DNA polymerase III delta prime subunit
MPHVIKRGYSALRNCYRPMSKDEFYGIPVDAILASLKKPNHSRVMMFSGPTGSGKTSVARYLGLLLNCLNSDGASPCLECENCKLGLSENGELIRELNMADKTGIDNSRDEIERLLRRPTKKGLKKILILDEAQQITGPAQQTWLKPLEELPEHSYVFLCTTQPEKFRQDLLGRVTHFRFEPLLLPDAMRFMKAIVDSEKIKDVDAVVGKEIFDKVGGLPRNLINALEKVQDEGIVALKTLGIGNEEEERRMGDLVTMLFSGAAKPSAVADLYYALLSQMGGKTEGLRIALGRYLEKILRNPNNDGAKKALSFKVLEFIRTPYYDNSESWVMLLDIVHAGEAITELCQRKK